MVAFLYDVEKEAQRYRVFLEESITKNPLDIYHSTSCAVGHWGIGRPVVCFEAEQRSKLLSQRHTLQSRSGLRAKTVYIKVVSDTGPEDSPKQACAEDLLWGPVLHVVAAQSKTT